MTWRTISLRGSSLASTWRLGCRKKQP